MFALRDLQAAVAAHLAGEDRPDLAAAIVGDSIAAEARLRVHRHHVAESLATALAATYSTVRAIVGEPFFRTMARAFAATDLPRQPVLAEYGGAFPAFVAGYGPAASLPYLADVAQLDWALNLAFHAPHRDRLAASDLADLPPEALLASRVALATGATLVRSAYPIDRIWHASRPGAAVGRVSLDEGPASVIVLRRSGDAAFASLSAAEAAFVAALQDARTLEEGARAALAVEPAFDLSATFARLLAVQAFAAMQHEC